MPSPSDASVIPSCAVAMNRSRLTGRSIIPVSQRAVPLPALASCSSAERGAPTTANSAATNSALSAMSTATTRNVTRTSTSGSGIIFLVRGRLRQLHYHAGYGVVGHALHQYAHSPRLHNFPFVRKTLEFVEQVASHGMSAALPRH